MKDFRKNLDRKVWGVLGKQKEYYHPAQFLGEKIPLNANPLDAWDTKKSRYKRVDLVPRNAMLANDEQQSGVPETSSSPSQVTPTPTVTNTSTPTPSVTMTNTPTNTSSSTPTPTPSFTPTNTITQTQTNTPTLTQTPTSTPYPLPSTPDLWYDATNVGSIDYITSGGTNYVSGWRSIGTYQKYLTGTTTNTMPIWSASTIFPGSPLVVRFTKNATAGLQDFLSQRFDSTTITGAGLTVFTVIAKPSEYNYSASSSTNGFGIQMYFYSGNSATGGFVPTAGAQPPRLLNSNMNNGNDLTTLQVVSSGASAANTFALSATNLNNKFLFTQVVPYPTGNPYIEINQSGATLGTQVTGTPITTFSSFVLGGSVTSGGTVTTSNAGAEVAEIMIYTKELTVQQQEAVQNYLKDKWSYDSWASPVPTPTQTASPTQTPTQTVTPSRPASGTTQAQTYLSAVVNAGGTGITPTVSAATITLFTSLVSNGLYDKMLAFYPMLGGNSSGCKFNGKNPVDTDAGYRLTFNGGWTYNASGATSNGTNAYADTFLSGGTITARNNHLSVYMLNNTVYTGSGKNWIGVSATGGSGAFFSIGQEGTPYYFYGNKINAGWSTTVAPQPQGFNIITTTAITFQNLYRNGIVKQTNSSAGDGTITSSVVIGALNNAGSIIQYYDNTYAFATIGLGLSEAEQSTLSTIINTFQTSLGRNTY